MDRVLFAEIMASFPSGVAIVTTTDDNGKPRGLTTTAVCSVSMEPPMLLVCVDKTSRTLGTLRERGRFVVNFIRQEDAEVCERFASKRSDKFADLSWQATAGGMPLLSEHAVSWAECATAKEVDAGDHVILLGEVHDGGMSERKGHAALYYRRSWGRWHPTARGAAVAGSESAGGDGS